MKVAIVFDSPYRGYTPEDHDRRCEIDMARAAQREPDMEYQVGHALRSRGHEVTFVGVGNDAFTAIDWLKKNPVDIVFNVTEAFDGQDTLDYLVPALLESGGINYTGSPPLSLMVTRNKAMSKEVLRQHGLHVPAFRTYRVGEPVEADPGFRYPLIVKPLSSDASAGIAQASIVHDIEQLKARVEFVHERFGSSIVEEFIEGRELHVSMLGNEPNAKMLPILEVVFDKERTAPEERIITVRAKWDDKYRARKKIKTQYARPLSQVALERVEQACRVSARALWLRDYYRLDVRLDSEDNVWVLEANANPYLCRGHEVAMSAEKSNINYEDLMEQIIGEACQRVKPKRVKTDPAVGS